MNRLGGGAASTGAITAGSRISEGSAIGGGRSWLVRYDTAYTELYSLHGVALKV